MRRKACFNEKCTSYKNKDKYTNDKYNFCPICASELSYVCNDRACYNPLPNVRKKFCDDCLVVRDERKEKAKTQALNIAKSVPTAVASVATVAAAVVGLKRDVTKIIPKK